MQEAPWELELPLTLGVRDLQFVTTFSDSRGLLGTLNGDLEGIVEPSLSLLDRAQLYGLICHIGGGVARLIGCGILEFYQTGGQAPYY